MKVYVPDSAVFVDEGYCKWEGISLKLLRKALQPRKISLFLPAVVDFQNAPAANVVKGGSHSSPQKRGAINFQMA